MTRFEFDWIGIDSHTIQLNMEGAYNSLDQNFLQTDDTGAGPVVVDVPGSNTKVEELRGDFVLADTWSLSRIDFNYGLGAEVSEIKQTGDAELKRDFFFVKPHAILIYSPQQSNQTRARIAREVSQLDFNDFISATVFQDDDLALGNPNLQPETTWVADLTHERRFGDIGLFKFRLYYHWISNVEDLLPLTSDFEAPGNIGNGNRRGIEVESTVPMDWLGIKSSRLDFKGRVQDSSVTDPVTGEKRQLSSVGRLSAMIPYNDIDLDYIIAVDFRQDFEVQSMAWGWEVRERAERPRFKVNELDVFNEGTELNIFVETTRWLGMKIQFTAKDVFDSQKLRTRTIYTGERSLSAIDRNEITDVTRGRQFEILFNGSF
jgi:outer membrane receptor protein involved in Fe transport